MSKHYDRETNTLTIEPGQYDNLHKNNAIDQITISPNGHTIYIIPHVIIPPPFVRNFFARKEPDKDGIGIKSIKYYFCLSNSYDADYIWTWENSFDKDVVYLEKFPGKRPERLTDNMNICLPVKFFEVNIVNKVQLTVGRRCEEGFYIPLLAEESDQIPTVNIVQNTRVYHSPNKSRQSEKNIEFAFAKKPTNAPRPKPLPPPPGVTPITTEQRINDIRKQPKVDGNGVYRSTDIRPATAPITLAKKNGDKQEYRVKYETQYDLVRNIRNRLQQSKLDFEAISNPSIQSSARVLTPNKSQNRIASKPRDRIRDTPTPSKSNSVSFGPSFKNIGFQPKQELRSNSQSLHIEDLDNSESTEIYQFMAPESPIQPIQPPPHISSTSGLNSKIHIPPDMMPRPSSAKSKNSSSKTRSAAKPSTAKPSTAKPSAAQPPAVKPSAQPVIKFKGFGFQGFNKDNDMGDIPD